MRRVAAITAVVVCAGFGAMMMLAPPLPPAPQQVVGGSECKDAPAVWLVEDADSQVWIMGVPSTMRANMPWNQSCVRKILDGARMAFPRFYLRSEMTMAENAKLVLKGDKPPATPLEDRIGGDVLAVFAKYASILNIDGVLSNSSTAVAAEQMYQRGPRVMGFPANEPNPTITALASEYNVPMAPGRVYSSEPINAALADKPEAEAIACLKQASDLTWVRGLIEDMSRVWSVGDVPGMRAVMSRSLFKGCLGNPGREQINRQGATDFVADAAEQLKTPGKVFMMIGIDPLLSVGGVLDQLNEKGFRVVGVGYAQS